MILKNEQVTIVTDTVAADDPGLPLDAEDLRKVGKAASREINRLFADLFGPAPKATTYGA